MDQGDSAPFTNLPFDIRERIFGLLAWSIDSKECLALMVLSKDMYDLISKVYYHTILFPVAAKGMNDCPFELLIKNKPPGFFQAKIEAIWLSPYLTLCSTFLKNSISTFPNLCHIGFDIARGRQLQEFGDSLFDFGDVLSIESGKVTSNSDSTSLESWHALCTVTRFYASTFVTGYYHVPRMVQWLYNLENCRLVVLIVRLGYSWQADYILKNVKQDVGVKVILLEPSELPWCRTSWKYSMSPFGDPHRRWARAEAARKKAEEPVPPALSGAEFAGGSSRKRSKSHNDSPNT
ncbi:hypothetical protein DL96DRAFT_1558648 [Flagelloscypha sp. PMI_526]|nr:hypothetical protein DL96DRAFT_1558648 [Flagelloscypha sp. PMI_526]